MANTVEPGTYDSKADPRALEANLLASQIGDAVYYYNNKPRFYEGETAKQLIRSTLEENFTYEAELKGKHLIAYVTRVLKDDESIAPLNNESNKNRIKDLRNRKIVFAHVLGFEGHGLPRSKNDEMLQTMVGAYYSFKEDSDNEFNNVKKGSYVWVKIFGENTAEKIEGFSGQLIGLFAHAQPLVDLVVDERSKIKFSPSCKTELGYTGLSGKLLRGLTDPRPSVGQPVIRKFKTKIKTGIYGNGSAQTKAHFNQCLYSHKQSFGYEVSPSTNREMTLGSRNSFIWVGHLRNNGYLDILDRPADLGRETIIYAPMTLNVYAPIEIKYYFHDRGGFGTAWTNGPYSTTDNAIENATDVGNDFTEKVAPGIADMIRDKRNFILVIPEMAFSRGFGTADVEDDAILKYQTLLGENENPIKIGEKPSSKVQTIRSKLKSESAPIVMKYLKRKISLNGPESITVLQKTHLRERETVTFDGSYTGGNFSNFDAEVLEVIRQYLGQSAFDNITYKSIIADGLGAINMASMAKTYPTYGQQSGFNNVVIDRIDYIENGQNLGNSYNFSESPLLSFYRDYISISPRFPRLEFNYVGLSKPPAPSGDGERFPGKKMFNEIGFVTEYLKGIKNSGPPEQRFFAEPLGTSGPLISMHTVSEVDLGAKYSFYLRTDSDRMLTSQNQIPNSTLINLPSDDNVPDHAGSSARRLSDGVLQEYAKKKQDLVPDLKGYESLIESLDDPINRLRVPEIYRKNTSEYLKNRVDYHKYEEIIRQEIEIKRYKRNRAKMVMVLNDKKNGILKQLEEKKAFLNSQEEFNTIFPKNSNNVNSFSIYFDFNEKNVPVNKDYTFKTAYERLKKDDLKVPTFNQQTEQKIFVAQFAKEDYSGQLSGIFDIICREIAQGEALEELKNSIEKTIESLEPLETVGPANNEECAPAPLTLDFLRRNEAPVTFNRADRRIDELACEGKNIRVVSNYRDLRQMIEWDPNIPSLKSEVTSKKGINAATSLTSTAQDGLYRTKHFKYKSRGRNNSIKFRNSPPIWACISKKVEEAWEAACNISGYVPFRVFNGIKGFLDPSLGDSADPTPGINIYQSGIEVGTWGLTLTVDNPIAPYNGSGDPVYSVFTNTWSGKFLETYQDELYELGVLSDLTFSSLDGTFGISGRYLDNAYEGFFSREKRKAENWKNASDSSYNDSTEEQYDNVMNSADGSDIVPDGANPLLWVLTFCERSGMKWGNSFFMRKRHRGPREGIQFFGFANRSDTPISWDLAEQKRISAIYGIEDVVARVNAISFPQTTYDAHMHFQYYSGPAIIPWKEIEGYRG